MIWTPEQQRIIASELLQIERIADSLQREIGNETTLELVDRLKMLRKTLGSQDWRHVTNES